MLQPWDKGIVLWTLRYGDEVRDEDEYFKSVKGEKPDANMLDMVGQIIEDRTVAWSDSMVKDPVQDRLLDIIKSKKSTKRKTKAKDEPEINLEPQSNVIDLMAALKKSLENKADPAKKSR
jgi:DNA end-binding protein Ku